MLSTNWNFASKSQNFIAMFHHNPGLTFNFWNFKIFPVLKVNSLCKIIFLIFFGKFPVFSLSGKSKNQIPCFPCAVATLGWDEKIWSTTSGLRTHSVRSHKKFSYFCRVYTRCKWGVVLIRLQLCNHFSKCYHVTLYDKHFIVHSCFTYLYHWL